jgi:hypothetical protein
MHCTRGLSALLGAFAVFAFAASNAFDPFPGTHTVQGFNAVRGYDLASGLGTADGTALVSELAGRRGFKRR